MDLDPEMKALRAVVRAMEPLPLIAQRRVIGYLHEALSPTPEPAPEQPPSDGA